MSNIEKLVPSLELCKLIPEGEFQDSALSCCYWAFFVGSEKNL